MKDLDENGMEHHTSFTLLSAYSVSVGHQRVWYASTRIHTYRLLRKLHGQEAMANCF